MSDSKLEYSTTGDVPFTESCLSLRRLDGEAYPGQFLKVYEGEVPLLLRALRETFGSDCLKGQ